MKKTWLFLVFLALTAVVGGSGYLLYNLLTITRQSEELMKDKLVLETQNDRLSEAISHEKNEKEQKEAELNFLRKELDSLQDVRKLKELFNENQARLAQLDANYANAEKENKLLKQTNLTLEGRLKNITAEFTQTLDMLKNSRNEVMEFKSGKVMNSYLDTIKKNEALLKQREDEIVKLRENIKSLSVDSDSMSRQKRELETEIVRLGRGKDKAEKDAEKARLNLDKQNEMQAKVEEKLRQLIKQVEEKELQQRGLNKEIESLRGVGAKNEQLLKQREDEIVKLRENIKSLSADSDSMSRQKKDLEVQITELGKGKEKAEKEVETARLSLEQQNELQIKAQERIKQLAKQVEEKELQQQGLNKELDGLRSVGAKNEQLLKEREDEISKLRESIKNLSADFDSISRQKKDFEAQLAELGKGREKAEKETETAKLSLEQQNELQMKAQETIKQLAKQVEEKELQRKQLNNDVEELRNTKDMIEQELSLQTEKISSLEAELAAMKDKVENVSKLEAEKKMIEESLARATEELEKQKKVISELEKKELASKSQVTVSEGPFQGGEPVSAMQDKLNKAYALYDTAKAQVVKFSELLMNKEVELETARQKINTLETELRDVQERYRRTMEDLNRATKLNIDLQESLGKKTSYAPQVDDQSADKMKAEKLKREIELLLGK